MKKIDLAMGSSEHASARGTERGEHPREHAQRGRQALAARLAQSRAHRGVRIGVCRRKAARSGHRRRAHPPYSMRASACSSITNKLLEPPAAALPAAGCAGRRMGTCGLRRQVWRLAPRRDGGGATVRAKSKKKRRGEEEKKPNARASAIESTRVFRRITKKYRRREKRSCTFFFDVDLKRRKSSPLQLPLPLPVPPLAPASQRGAARGVLALPLAWHETPLVGRGEVAAHVQHLPRDRAHEGP